LAGLNDDNKGVIRDQIERLREEHRDLDAAIEALIHAGAADRLKKRKLALRDRMTALQDESTPDIIA
jgi:hypothetical protein